MSIKWHKVHNGMKVHYTEKCFNDIIATILSFLHFREMYWRALPAGFADLITLCPLFEGQLLTRPRGSDMTFSNFFHKDFSHPEALSRKQLVTCSAHNSLGVVSDILCWVPAWGRSQDTDPGYQCPDGTRTTAVGMHRKTQHSSILTFNCMKLWFTLSVRFPLGRAGDNGITTRPTVADERFQRVCHRDSRLLCQDKQNGGKGDCVQWPTPSLQHWHNHAAKSRLTEDKQRARDRLGNWHSANQGGRKNQRLKWPNSVALCPVLTGSMGGLKRERSPHVLACPNTSSAAGQFLPRLMSLILMSHLFSNGSQPPRGGGEQLQPSLRGDRGDSAQPRNNTSVLLMASTRVVLLGSTLILCFY